MAFLLTFIFLADANLIEQRFQSHIRFLASDALEGRETTFTGQKVAAEYLAAQLSLHGLQPAYPESSTPYFQKFELDVTGIDPNSVFLEIKGHGPPAEWSYQWEFFVRPIGIGTFSEKLPMVFGGYGIDSSEYNDYEGISVKGAWAIMLDGQPTGEKFPFDMQESGLFYKHYRAKDKGAKGIIVLKRGAPDANIKHTFSRRRMRFPQGVDKGDDLFPVIQIHEAHWPPLFGGYYKRFKKAAQAIHETGRPRSFSMKRRQLDFKVKVRTQRRVTENVIAVIPGQDPVLRDEYLVVSAHYDHVGIVDGQIYNGADDNASGAATMLILAEQLGTRKRRRSVIVLFTSGEEQGLLGAKHYVSEPNVPLNRIVANINTDMIGRARDKKLAVIPAKNEDVSTLNLILARVNEERNHGFELTDNLDRFHRRSDHFAFAGQDIPAVFLFAGLHEHYHSPNDDWQRIEFDGLAKTYALLEDFVVHVLNQNEKPSFLEPRDSQKETPD